MFRVCALCLCLSMTGCAYSQENNSFAEKQVYSTNAFRFEVPRPWYYAAPDATKKKNVARCFLHSRLQILAQGLFLVDAGRAVGTREETIEAMLKVMKSASADAEIQREDVVLDGDKAVHLKSAVANYRVPCSVIVDDRNGTLYLLMMSVSKRSDLENRDLMVRTLLATWKWKQSRASESKQ